jgi:hypothetical protein
MLLYAFIGLITYKVFAFIWGTQSKPTKRYYVTLGLADTPPEIIGMFWFFVMPFILFIIVFKLYLEEPIDTFIKNTFNIDD